MYAFQHTSGMAQGASQNLTIDPRLLGQAQHSMSAPVPMNGMTNYQPQDVDWSMIFDAGTPNNGLNNQHGPPEYTPEYFQEPLDMYDMPAPGMPEPAATPSYLPYSMIRMSSGPFTSPQSHGSPCSLSSDSVAPELSNWRQRFPMQRHHGRCNTGSFSSTTSVSSGSSMARRRVSGPPRECPFCGTSYPKPFNNQRHQNNCRRIHEGLKKPFKCKSLGCEKRYTREEHLRKHYTEKHRGNTI